jgi:hypothetical protein
MNNKSNANIERDLLAGFSEPSGDIQEKACLQAIQDIGYIANKSGFYCDFMIELRDFLLDYNKKM